MIKHELTVFVVVGATTVLIDFFVYRGLIGFGGIDVDTAKAIGFVVGTVFAYAANRFWTFRHNTHAPGSALRFAVLYTSTLGANVLINSIGLKILANSLSAVQLAFLIATGVSASLNFLGMKFFVFKQRRVI
jgi:putative flippase GtrA